MNFWQILVVKISHALTAVMIVIGLGQTATPQATIVEVQPEIIQAVETTTPVVSPPAQAVVVKTKQTTTTMEISIEIPEATSTPTASGPEPIYIPIIIQPAPMPVIEPVAPSTTETMPAEKVKTYRLSVISPMNGKGLNRDGQYLSSPEVKDEANYIELGLVIYDEEGNSVRTSEVVVNATDDTQKKYMGSTGNVTKIYNDGIPKTVHYYPFHYEFKSPGVHKITFAAEGLLSEVSLDVAEDTRK